MSIVQLIIVKGSQIGCAKVHIRNLQECLDKEQVEWQELDAGYVLVDKNNNVTVNAQAGVVLKTNTEVFNI